MANITTENINTLAQLAASISDGDYIYIYKSGANTFARIEKSLFMQGSSQGGGAASDVTIDNVNAIQAKVDELIGKIANFALSSSVNPIGTLDWGDSGDDPVTPVPALTSPTHNSSVNVGEIAYDGTSVSTSIYIKGSNLTLPLALAITGTGLSVSTSSVTAANANNGVNVNVTYANSASGTATTSGTLTISSSELSSDIVVSLTASKAADVTPSGYVTSGLVLHLDGLNQGGTSGKWIDSVGNKEFVLTGATAASNGVLFDEEGEMGVYNGTNPEWMYTGCTIEVCLTALSGFNTTNRVLFGNGVDSGIAAIYSAPSGSTKGWAFGVWSHTSYTDLGNTSKRADSDTISGAITLSMNAERLVKNGSTNTGTLLQTRLGVAKNVALTVGGMLRTGDTLSDATFFANATIHEVRIYNRQLSEAEMLQNQRYDNERYNLGLTI